MRKKIEQQWNEEILEFCRRWLDLGNTASHIDNKKHILKDFDYFLLVLKTAAFFRKKRFEGVKRENVKIRRELLKKGDMDEYIKISKMIKGNEMMIVAGVMTSLFNALNITNAFMIKSLKHYGDQSEGKKYQISLAKELPDEARLEFAKKYDMQDESIMNDLALSNDGPQPLTRAEAVDLIQTQMIRQLEVAYDVTRLRLSKAGKGEIQEYEDMVPHIIGDHLFLDRQIEPDFLNNEIKRLVKEEDFNKDRNYMGLHIQMKESSMALNKRGGPQQSKEELLQEFREKTSQYVENALNEPNDGYTQKTKTTKKLKKVDKKPPPKANIESN